MRCVFQSVLLKLSLDAFLLGRWLFALHKLPFHRIALHLYNERVVVAFAILDECLVRMKLAMCVEWICLIHFLMMSFR